MLTHLFVSRSKALFCSKLLALPHLSGLSQVLSYSHGSSPAVKTLQAAYQLPSSSHHNPVGFQDGLQSTN